MPTDEGEQPGMGEAVGAVGNRAADVLVPVELRFERVAGDTSAARVVLHLALVDTRLARVRWSGDVVGDAASSLSPSLLASVADRVANLAAPTR